MARVVIILQYLRLNGVGVEIESDPDVDGGRVDDEGESDAVGGDWQSVGQQLQQLEHLRRLVNFIRQVNDERHVEHGPTAVASAPFSSVRRRTDTLEVRELTAQHR